MYNIPLIDLSEAYIKLINSTDSLALHERIAKAETPEELLAIKKSLETKIVFPDFDDLELEKKIADLANRFAIDFDLSKHTEQILGSGLAKFAEISEPLASIARKPDLMGIWILAKYATRSNLVKKQIDPKSVNYCSLVPLILSSYKKYQDRAYSSWNSSIIKALTSKDLYDAMMCDVSDIKTDVVLQDREIALTNKTTGKLRPAQSTYALYTPASSQLYALPKLAQIMVCQTWCAHPTHRTRYMVLDPSNWDSIPNSLIESVFINDLASLTWDKIKTPQK